MDYQEYHNYLQSEAWRQVRQRKIASVGSRCERCGKRFPGELRMLEVHHLTYKRLGKERDEDLQALCAVCHRREHGRIPESQDWHKVRVVYGWETLGDYAELLEQRRRQYFTVRDIVRKTGD